MSLNKDFSKSLNQRVAKISCNKVHNWLVITHVTNFVHTQYKESLLLGAVESCKQKAIFLFMILTKSMTFFLLLESDIFLI